MWSQDVTCWQVEETVNPRMASVALGLNAPAGQPGIVGPHESTQVQASGYRLRGFPPYLLEDE